MKIKTVHVIVVVLVVIAAILAYESISSDICPYLTVSEITKDSEYVGKKVKILGTVTNAPTGWSEAGFLLFNLTDGQATIAVTYTGSLSQSLKDGQEVGVIGVMDTPYHVNAAQLDIKCASKYE
jgi:cytochrome c-type biogenesis protein CcmE